MNERDNQLERLKQIELEMLKAFIEVSDKLNLKYYVIGGTLLGAVRHKGFIPWDDDIDVVMLREDYEILMRKGQEYLPEKYFLQNTKSDPEWLGNFAKIRDSETTFIESSIKNCKINHGVYIDIFPLDYYPESRMKAKILWVKKRNLSRCVGRIYSLKLSFLQKIKHKLGQLPTIFLSPARAAQKLEKMYKSIKPGEYVINYSSCYGIKEKVPKQWFGEGCQLEFEGLSVTAPTEYELWLKHIFGNYMQLPPVEERVGHHYTEVTDFDNPYTKYIVK